MSLFSKKKDVPELPRAPTLPRLPDDSSRPHMLPSISSRSGGPIGNQMVKFAVTDSDSDSEMDMPMHTMPMMRQSYSEPSSGEDHKKEVFVKLDKFTQAQKTFAEVRMKMMEIEALVNKAKQLNEKEKSELASWDQELKNIKSKVGEIDSEIFDQV